MARVSRKRATPAPAPAAAPQLTGPKRYTPFRFLSDCRPETEEWLRGEWAEGNQLFTHKVPVDALPPVLILACYARVYGVELVDDYDFLLQRYDSLRAEFAHPDKFFSSCITILATREQWPDTESFESINIPAIYEELLQ